MLIVGTNGMIAVLLPYAAENYPLGIRGRATGLVAGASKFGGVAVQGFALLGLHPDPGRRGARAARADGPVGRPGRLGGPRDPRPQPARARSLGMTIRVALLGRGMAGTVFHAPLIRAVPALELAAVAGSADAAAAIASPDIDLVVVATPNATHFPLAAAALEAGKHVVVDKPFAVSLAEADALIALAAAKRRFSTVFHNRRWDGDFLTVRQPGRVGPARRRRAISRRIGTASVPLPRPGWRETPAVGAGLLWDLGPHLIDQALLLFGRPDAGQRPTSPPSARARGPTIISQLTLDYGAMRVLLRPQPGRGAAAAFRGPRHWKQLRQIRPRPAGGGAEAGPVAAGPRLRRRGSRVGRRLRRHRRRASDSRRPLPGRYLAFYEGVAAAIGDGAPPPVDPADAREGLRIISRSPTPAVDLAPASGRSLRPMTPTEPNSVWDVAAELGEGPVWVDATAPCGSPTSSGARSTATIPRRRPGAAGTRPSRSASCCRREGGGFVAGLMSGLHRFDEATGGFALIVEIEPERPNNRLNDGVVDPAGRLWFGTMDNGETEQDRRLLPLRARRRRPAPASRASPSPTARPSRPTAASSISSTRAPARSKPPTSPRTARSGPPRPFVRIDPADGFPDGPTVDSEGCVWIALYAGWEARRYSPAGELIGRVRFPVANITKIAFGGDDLRTAYATTARQLLRPDAARAPARGGRPVRVPGRTCRACPAR